MQLLGSYLTVGISHRGLDIQTFKVTVFKGRIGKG